MRHTENQGELCGSDAPTLMLIRAVDCLRRMVQFRSATEPRSDLIKLADESDSTPQEQRKAKMGSKRGQRWRLGVWRGSQCRRGVYCQKRGSVESHGERSWAAASRRKQRPAGTTVSRGGRGNQIKSDEDQRGGGTGNKKGRGGGRCCR